MNITYHGEVYETISPPPPCHAERMAALVDDLVSGGHTKAQGHLFTASPAPAYCCLGRATELSGLGSWNTATCQYVISGASSASYYSMPAEVTAYYGLGPEVSSECGNLLLARRMRDGRELWAAMLNDDRTRDWSLAEIGAIIREVYLPAASTP